MIYEFNGIAPQIDATAHISESAVIIGDVTIGPRCYIGPGAILRGDGGRIIIEEECAVEDGVIIHIGGAATKVSVLSRRVTIGHGAIVHSSYIGPCASVGMGAVLSIRSEIGEYAVVAESAVVRQGQKIEPHVVVGGIPAKVLRPLGEADIATWDATKDYYVRLAAQYNTEGMLRRLD